MSRWSDLAEWRGPTPNQSGAMLEQRGLVVHIASGFYEGTISWEKNPNADVSSHFVSGREGQMAQIVDTDRTAWTQRDGNGHWLSVECEGFATDDALHATHPGWEKLTDAQMDGVARLLARGHQQYGYPLQLAGSPDGRGLGYHSMGAEHGYNWGHLHCPGEPIKAQLPEILARAQRMVTGPDTTNLQEVPMFLATTDGKQYYLCDGQVSRPVSLADAQIIAYGKLSGYGPTFPQLLVGDPAHNPTTGPHEWVDLPRAEGGVYARYVRLGWGTWAGAVPTSSAPGVPGAPVELAITLTGTATPAP